MEVLASGRVSMHLRHNFNEFDNCGCGFSSRTPTSPDPNSGFVARFHMHTGQKWRHIFILIGMGSTSGQSAEAVFALESSPRTCLRRYEIDDSRFGVDFTLTT